MDAIHLSSELIAAPPVELWPQVVARLPVPPDLQLVLIDELSKE